MDWFLYDNGLRHERVKWESIYIEQEKRNNCILIGVKCKHNNSIDDLMRNKVRTNF